MSFLIFLILLIIDLYKTRIQDRYSKLLYFSVPKMSGNGTEIIWNK